MGTQSPDRSDEAKGAYLPRNVFYLVAVVFIIALGVSYQSIEFLQVQIQPSRNSLRESSFLKDFLWDENDNKQFPAGTQKTNMNMQSAPNPETLNLFWIKDVFRSSSDGGDSIQGDNVSESNFSGREYTSPCEEDPLDDRCKNERFPAGGFAGGFPDVPLIPETALLCDKNINIRLGKNSETVCPQDPTCKKCSRSYETTKRMQEYFHRGDEERKERLMKWFPIPQGKESRDIIVCSVNYGQLYLFLNWACSCWKNQVFDARLYAWIIPTDEKTYNTLVALGFHAEPLNWMNNAGDETENRIHLSSQYTGNANSGAHAQINSITAFASNFAVQMGYYTLLMDVDLIFLHNPFPWLHRSSDRRDVLGMYSPRKDNYGFMNSGFLFFVPTEKTKLLLQSYENLCPIKKISDQQLWNVVIRHYAFRQISQRILPRQVFFTLWRSAEKYGYNTNVTKVLHAVSVRKAGRFMEINQWHFNAKCPFWDKPAHDEANKYGLLNMETEHR